MANPIILGFGVACGIFEVTSTTDSIALEPDYDYSFQHTGVTKDGSTAATGAVLLSRSSVSFDSDLTGDNKILLTAGNVATIGPEWDVVHMITNSDSPVVNINRSPKYSGKW